MPGSTCETKARTVELHTGASDTQVRLPRAAGATNVRAESGAASLTIEVPPGVAARIHGTMVIGSSQVDQARFPRTADGYESPDYTTAANRVDIVALGRRGLREGRARAPDRIAAVRARRDRR